jgi:hypothetical protein
MALLDRGMKLDLRGSQIIYVPNVTTLPALPVFVAENAAAPSVQWQWGRTQIGPARKILVLSGITGEMEQSSPDNAAAIVGRVLADRTNANIDKVAFSTTADNGTQPQGLLYNVTPITASTSTDQLAALAADLGALVGAIGTASIDPTGVVFVAPPREAMIIAARIGTANASVLMTLGLPNKTVAAFAPAGVISGWRDPPDISTSREALVHEEGQTPLPIGQPGSPNTVAAPARSMFQTNAISIRVRAWAAWACVPGAAQVVNSVNW